MRLPDPIVQMRKQRVVSNINYEAFACKTAHDFADPDSRSINALATSLLWLMLKSWPPPSILRSLTRAADGSREYICEAYFGFTVASLVP